MGSPSARLDADERYRPWLESGLEYLLRPIGKNMHAGSAEPASKAQPAPTPQVAALHSGAPPHSPRQGVDAVFPEPWASFLAAAPAQPKVVWTYMELGLDLGGQPDPQRRAILGNLLNHLKWPKGTAAFWPVAALQNGTLQPDAAMFWKGWERWRTSYVVCFGREALTVVKPDAPAGSEAVFLEQTAIHVMPSLSELMQQLPHERQMAVDSLLGLRF